MDLRLAASVACLAAAVAALLTGLVLQSEAEEADAHCAASDSCYVGDIGGHIAAAQAFWAAGLLGMVGLLLLGWGLLARRARPASA